MERKPLLKLIVGLGNPDGKYKNTYHNIGHLFIDAVNENSKFKIQSLKLLKTDGFMNTAGVFVVRALKKQGLRPETLLVVHDDSDLLIGTYKLAFGRGAAGHHGVESVIKNLKTKNFWRLRIGVRPKPKPGALRLKADQFVLKKITLGSRKVLDSVFKKASAAVFGDNQGGL